MIIANILGIFVFLFVLWHRLRQDYHFEKTFTLAFYTLTGVLISYLVAKQFFPEFWFWVESLGVLVGFSIGVIRQKMRVYESFEGVLIGLLIWLSLTFMADSVVNASLASFLAFWITVFSVFLFFFLDAHYRRFSWYKSGRVGFSGLAVTGIFFLTRSVVALLNIAVISLVGSLEGILSGSLSFISFLLLFNLSRKK
ncbi:hypothetical protein ISR94_00540 [Candidatus Microgenomates bacterium]|nr:hypothetical protein [Candidatus Microgenomates bacterium]